MGGYQEVCRLRKWASVAKEASPLSCIDISVQCAHPSASRVYTVTGMSVSSVQEGVLLAPISSVELTR